MSSTRAGTAATDAVGDVLSGYPRLQAVQPAEETGDGAEGMVADGLFTRIPVSDVALSQHLLPGIAGAAFSLLARTL